MNEMLMKILADPHAWLPFISATLLLILGLSVLLRDRFSRTSLCFSLLMFSSAIWLFSYSTLYAVESESVALQISRYATVFVILIPLLFYLFALMVLNRLRESRFYAGIACLVSAGLITTLFTQEQLFLQGVYQYAWGFFPRYGPMGFGFLMVHFTLILVSMRLYWRDYKSTRSKQRKANLRRFFAGFGVTVFSAIDYAPAFGIPIYPFGYVSLLIFIVIITRTVWLHRLKDITPAFAVEQILVTMLNGLFVIDTEGLIRIVNPSACRLLKKTEREMTLLPVWAVSETLITRAKLDSILQHRSAENYETVVVRKDGQKIQVAVTTSILIGHDKNPAAIVLIAKDISNEKKTQESLQRKDLYILLLQIIAVAANKAREPAEVLQLSIREIAEHMKWLVGHVFVRSPQSDEKLVSSQLWYFYDASKYINFKEATEKCVLEKGMDIAGQILEKVRGIGVKDVSKKAFMVRQRECEECHLLSAFAFPIVVEDKVEAVLEFFSDETIHCDEILMEMMDNVASQIARVYERRRSELRLKRIHDELEDRVETRTQELREANQKLTRLDELKTNFMLTASHELRTPLTALKGYLLLILDDKVGPLSQEQRLFLNHMKTALERLEKLVRELLNLTKIDMGMELLRMETVNLAKVLEEEVGMFRAQSEQRNITLSLQQDSEAGGIYSNEDRLREVIENLLGNALKYTPEGGYIDVSTKRYEDFTEILFKDTGIGIKAEVIDKIFEPFYRLHRQGVHGEMSTGLGLALTKRMIESMGGRIRVESVENVGSTFSIRIPNRIHHSI